ncbi:hypothetical protein [Spirosoma sp.]|uniref:hypothetical protein n=1 Tax=Spirosoma sp. TaxID=1899569 RepID=UPI00260BC717|nr:hypothetical protein [Spirosoma sp.]MCX6216524.1 hypothetical protein [Spirosoma sp.]
MMTTTNKPDRKLIVIEAMDELSMNIPIQWDRYTKTDDGYYVVYGWIARSDGQRDFIMLAMWETDKIDDIFFTTSSAKYSRRILEVLFGSAEDHNDCRKIDDLLSTPTYSILPNHD